MQGRLPHSHPFLGSAGLMTVAVLALHALMLPAAFSADAASALQPLSVTLQPSVSTGPLPPWAAGTLAIHPESDRVELPVPPLAAQEEIGCFALTVLFEDNGDGGPVVEWVSNQGEPLLLSAGLGENGVAVGLNARTLLLPQSLALDGGTARVSFAGRFSRLLSLSLRPAKELGIAALGNGANPPVLIDGKDRILDGEEVFGGDPAPGGGDRGEGRVLHAELSAPATRLDLPGSDSSMEIVVPLSSKPVGTHLRTEVAGLDPESWIEVLVNGESLGALGPASFALDAPEVRFSAGNRLQIAGWRTGTLYLPARTFRVGENSVTLTLRRAVGDEGRPVHLRNVQLDLLFASSGDSPPPGPNSTPPDADTLSTGSLYGNPSPSLFHAAPPAPLPNNSGDR